MSQMSSMSYTDFATFYVVGVGMGLSDMYRLIRFANFCNFFTFCTGILCNLGINPTPSPSPYTGRGTVAAMAMATAKRI